ncbi:MAG: flagellar biosynthetic protein FliO [Oscillospiraceae bacterium]|jgi:flagellar biogenesis protein FliO|nr:flagellar biosynthetic protein FliO [Oscillospiraceae bacterium]
MSARQVIVTIFGSLLVIFGAYYVTRFVGGRGARSGNSKAITLRDRFAVARDREFYLLQVRDTVYLVAMTAGGAAVLDKFPASDFADDDRAVRRPRSIFEAMRFPKGSGGSFDDVLRGSMRGDDDDDKR